MNKPKIAALVLANILAVTPVAVAGGLGDMRLPDGRFHAADSVSTANTQSGSVINFYTPTDPSHAKGWCIRPNWWGYPFGFVVFNK